MRLSIIIPAHTTTDKGAEDLAVLLNKITKPDSPMKSFWRREIPRRKNTQQFTDSEGDSEQKEPV